MISIIKSAIFCCFLALSSFTNAQNSDDQNALNKKFHEFDFWLGEWDVYKYGTDTLVGHSKIESIIDSVGLLENYWSAMGKYQGKSLNKYNSSNGIWEQFWIDNGGNTLKLAGGLNSGNMVLENKRETKDGPLQNKITWEKLEKGNVRQTWEVSKDGGNTWKTVFDGLYVGHKLKNGEMRK